MNSPASMKIWTMPSEGEMRVSPETGSGVSVGVGVSVSVGITVGDGVGVSLGAGVALGIGVSVAESVINAVSVAGSISVGFGEKARQLAVNTATMVRESATANR